MITLLLAFFVPQAAELAIWRKPDAQGRACASCHSPDGIELAAFRFADKDVLRRASRHLDAEDQASIVALLLRERKALPTRLSFDPSIQRPLQPGGSALPGADARTRDLAFAKQIAGVAPAFGARPIASLSDAKQARDQLLRLDLRSVRVGFDFSRLSEDGFHGPEHATMAQWFPDTPMNLGADVIQAQDAYLKEPSVVHLRILDQKILSANAPQTALQAFSLAKFRSGLVLQHRLRFAAGQAKEDIRQPLGTGSNANPMWLVGDQARIYSTSDASILGLPSDVARAKTQAISDQMHGLRLPWFWMGWLEDPALSHSGLQQETQTGNYFVRALIEDGPYPAHTMFVVAERMVRLAFAPDAWTFFTPRHFEFQFSGLAIQAMLSQIHESDPTYRRIAANTFRMALYLELDDLNRTGKVIRPESQAGQIRYVLTQLEGLTPADRALAAKVLTRLKSAQREVSK